MSIGEHASHPPELGRYVLYDQIASGGMATVHFGRVHGAVGFSRVVAIKRLRENYTSDASFVQMFLDEARLAARLKHPNVITTLDVVADESEVFLVMEYVLGESLDAMMLRPDSSGSYRPVPVSVASAILCNVLEGLHSAHEALSDTGERLEIVHRDVSPHNILVGADGIARVFDFGIAKAAINTQETRDGVIKGKVTYMAPEQVRGNADRRTDVYAAGVILWELLVGRRRHAGERNDSLFLKLAKNELEPPPAASGLRADVPPALDAIIARATASNPADRYESALEMAVALEAAVHPALSREVAEWVKSTAGTRIERLSDVMRRIEADATPRSDPRLPTMSRPVTSSVSISHAVFTGTRSGSLVPEVSSVHPPEAGRRRWSVPVLLVALLAVATAVGVRTLGRAGASARATRDASALANEAPPPAIGLPSLASASLSPGADGETPGAALRDASAQPSPAHLPTAQGARASGAAAATPRTGFVHAPVGAPAQPARSPARTPDPPQPAPQASAPAPAAAAPAHKASCDSPFVVGPDGIRQIKPECM